LGGPIYMSTPRPAATRRATAIGDDNLICFVTASSIGVPDARTRRPFMAAVKRSRRINMRQRSHVRCVHLCGRGKRGRIIAEKARGVNAVAGLGARGAIAGCCAVSQHFLDNVASQGVARRLQLSLIGWTFI